jgi:hypothetical protein
MSIIKIILVSLLMPAAYADVMNLNEFMPTRLEDSKVIKEKTMEVQLSSDFQKMDQDETIFRENVRYGVSEKLQMEMLSNHISGGGEEGSGEILLGGQYDIIDQVGISPMIVFPTGKKEEGIDTHLKINQSSTILGSTNTPMLQFHVNVDWAHNNRRNSGERPDHYFYAAGFSYLFSDSGSVILDIHREEDQQKDMEINMLEFGTQYDIGYHYLVGLGTGVGIGDESPEWSGIFTILKPFAL